jgi:hypothetical protein
MPRNTFPDLMEGRVDVDFWQMGGRKAGNFSTTSLRMMNSTQTIQNNGKQYNTLNKGDDIKRRRVVQVTEELHDGMDNAGRHLRKLDRSDMNALDEQLSVLGRL